MINDAHLLRKLPKASCSLCFICLALLQVRLAAAREIMPEEALSELRQLRQEVNQLRQEVNQLRQEVNQFRRTQPATGSVPIASSPAAGSSGISMAS